MKAKPLIGFIVLLTLPGVGRAEHWKLSKELRQTDPNGTPEVIVQFTHAPTKKHYDLVTARGGTLRKNLSVVKGGVFRVPAKRLAELANDPNVAYISPNRPVK